MAGSTLIFIQTVRHQNIRRGHSRKVDCDFRGRKDGTRRGSAVAGDAADPFQLRVRETGIIPSTLLSPRIVAVVVEPNFRKRTGTGVEPTGLRIPILAAADAVAFKFIHR